jgi:hypothetical protein
VSLQALTLAALIALPIVGLLGFAGCVLSHATARPRMIPLRLLGAPADANVTAVTFSVRITSAGTAPRMVTATATRGSDGTWSAIQSASSTTTLEVTCTPTGRPAIGPATATATISATAPASIDFHLAGRAGSYVTAAGPPAAPGREVSVVLVLDAPPADAGVTAVRFGVATAAGAPAVGVDAVHGADGAWTATFAGPPGSWEVACDPAAAPDVAALRRTVAVDARTLTIVFHLQRGAAGYEVQTGPNPPPPAVRMTLTLTFPAAPPPGTVINEVRFRGSDGTGLMLADLGAGTGDVTTGFSFLQPTFAGRNWTVVCLCTYTLGGMSTTVESTPMDAFVLDAAPDQTRTYAMSWPGGAGAPAQIVPRPSD